MTIFLRIFPPVLKNFVLLANYKRKKPPWDAPQEALIIKNLYHWSFLLCGSLWNLNVTQALNNY